MRNLILGVAALIAVAAPGAAMAQATGYVDASYSNVSVDTDFGDDDADGWAAGGAVAFDAYALGVQLDAGYSNTSADDGGGDTDAWTIGGHLFKRTDTWLLGGFAGFGNVDADGAGDSDYWTVGAEGQYYLERTTLDASISYSEADDADANVTAVNAGATYFFTDNFSVNGGVGFANAEAGGDDVDAISAGLGAEYQFASVPVSVFGGYAHSEVDDLDISSDGFTVGVRYNFGGTLFDRNRSGASLSRVGIGGLLNLL